MPKLSKQIRDRLDAAVLLAATRLQHDTLTLRKVQYSRPDKFSVFISRYIVITEDTRALLESSSVHPFFEGGFDRRVSMVDNSLRRLYRRGKLRKDKLSVPVLLGGRVGNESHRLATRYMLCYWPTNILDQIVDS